MRGLFDVPRPLAYPSERSDDLMAESRDCGAHSVDTSVDAARRSACATSFRIASAGNLIAWKGVEFGLRAFALVLREFPHAEYWVIGDGPERARLAALTEELNIAGCVRFLGALPRRSALEKLAGSDVLLLPSLHDSGGCICTEAMAIGRPVVCLDLGGPALQVTERTGIRVPAITPAQVVSDLASALRLLAGHPDLRRRMGAAGRTRVERHFSWEIRGREFADIYLRVARAPVTVVAK